MRRGNGTEEVDVLVAGAGPAGLTLAGLLAKYRPGTKVLVLEKERFPRHKIGEGLIVDVNRILLDLDALDAVEAAGFPRKYGSTFLWGEDRCPRTFLFRDGEGLVVRPDGYQLDFTWHVDRPSYDRILRDVAVGHGAEVREGTSLVAPVSEGGRVVGAVVRGEDGAEREVRARWTVDCAGGHGPLARTLCRETLDEELRNIALFAYYRDFGWRDDLQGPLELRRTLILTHPRGWVWLIPINARDASVGFVTSLRSFQQEKARRGGRLDPKEYYFEVLRELPEHDVLFGGAEVLDYRQDGRIVHTVQEFSYTTEPTWGPGWALSGDAAGFVDAILSIGCFVAQAHAQFLAYALGSVLDGDCDETLAMDAYATTVSENLESFRSITHMFYAFNRTRSDWWRESSDLLRRSALVPDGAERESFLAFVNGFTARHSLYEEALNSFGGLFLLGLGQSLFGGEEVFDEHAAESEVRRARRLVQGDPRLAVTVPFSTRAFALPHTGTGRLRPVTRLDLAGDDAPGRSIGRRLYLPAALAAVPGLLDGRTTLSEVARRVAAETGVPFDDARREVQKLAYRLARMGVVEAAAGAVGARV